MKIRHQPPRLVRPGRAGRCMQPQVHWQHAHVLVATRTSGSHAVGLLRPAGFVLRSDQSHVHGSHGLLRHLLGLVHITSLAMVVLPAPSLAKGRGAEGCRHPELLLAVRKLALGGWEVAVAGGPRLAQGSLGEVWRDRKLGRVVSEWAVLPVAALPDVVVAAQLGLVELLLEEGAPRVTLVGLPANRLHYGIKGLLRSPTQ
mmetsp:Transcript_100884/g.314503  ORF Transcript_100884/g.314503 Transcript_100884/m.314503 type:complete len:201 (-) Transcript_100884:58-660(-)